MNAVARDEALSFGLATEVLRGRRMKQLGEANARMRELKGKPNVAQALVDAAQLALDEAREAAALSQRMSDAEARQVLELEGVRLCKE